MPKFRCGNSPLTCGGQNTCTGIKRSGLAPNPPRRRFRELRSIGRHKSRFFSIASEIIGRWAAGFVVRLFRGEEVEFDHSLSQPAPKFWHAGGSITTRAMISEVLFRYFSRSWIPLIGGIQRAELFKEKVTNLKTENLLRLAEYPEDVDHVFFSYQLWVHNFLRSYNNHSNSPHPTRWTTSPRKTPNVP